MSNPDVKMVELDPTVAKITFESGMIAACAVASALGFMTDAQAKIVYEKCEVKSFELFQQTVPEVAKQHGGIMKVETEFESEGAQPSSEMMVEVLTMMRELEGSETAAKFPESVRDVCVHRVEQGKKLFRSAHADNDIAGMLDAVDQTAKDLVAIIEGAQS